MKVSHTVSLRSLLVLFLLLVSVGAAASSAFVSNSTLTPDSCVGAAASSAFVSTSTLTPSSCMGDGRGLVEIRAPSGSKFTVYGPWGYFYGTDSSGNPILIPTDPGTITCVIVDGCWGPPFQVTVQLPDGTVKQSDTFDLYRSTKWNAGINACYYLFDAGSGTIPPTPEKLTASVQVLPQHPVMYDAYGIQVKVHNPSSTMTPTGITCNEEADPTNNGQYYNDNLLIYAQKQYSGVNIGSGQDATYVFYYSHNWSWLRDAQSPGMTAVKYLTIAGPVLNYVMDGQPVITVAGIALRVLEGLGAKRDMTYTYDLSSTPSISGLAEQSPTVKVGLPSSKIDSFNNYIQLHILGVAMSVGGVASAETGVGAILGFATEAGSFIARDYYWHLAIDPDMNFNEQVDKEGIQIPEINQIPDIPSKQAIYDEIHLLEDLQALNLSINKYRGALTAGDDKWMRIHLTEASVYSQMASEDIARLHISIVPLINEIKSGHPTFTEEEINNAKETLANGNIPPIEREILNRFGYTDDDVTQSVKASVESVPTKYLQNWDGIIMESMDELERSQGNISNELHQYVTALPENQDSPIAHFTSNITSGYVPFPVQFTAIPIGNPQEFTWNFGDNTVSHEENPVHVYTGSGTYAVTLTVSNGYGSDTLVKADYITAMSPPLPPVAHFSAKPFIGKVPLSVIFTDKSLNAPAVFWTFGDGTSSLERNPKHVYIQCGIYRPILTATNPGGISTKEGMIFARNDVNGLIPQFKPRFSIGKVPLTVRFADTSKGAVSWEWQFGDGSSSSEKNPAHTYGKAGIYVVTLTAGDAKNQYSCRSGIVVALNPSKKLSMGEISSFQNLEKDVNSDED